MVENKRRSLMENQELKNLIKESIRKILREERLLLCNMLMPYISDQEQKELSRELGELQDYENEELINRTN